MARDPALSFRGALKILGKDEPAWLKPLDRALGGAILATGLINPLPQVWGWVDQKNEATSLLHDAVTWATNRITDTGGLRRHELVVAAHTTIVLTAFFNAARDAIGDLDITDAEKVAIAGHPRAGRSFVKDLYDTPVPTPSAIAGFTAVRADLGRWAGMMANSLRDFLSGLSVGIPNVPPLATSTVAEYRSLYLQLQTEVPEFAIWADNTAHDATHHALDRVEHLLTRGPGMVQRDAQATVAAVNTAELDRPVLDVNTEGYGVGAVMPTIDRIFISPHYKVGDEERTDLEWMLARHFTTADATTHPLVLLGHPGAGKSLLTKVLAARLSRTGYTAVRVPLRSVNANASIPEQIGQALKAQTNGAVTWPRLAAESTDELRVVLLDGLDELLQATGQDRQDYLHNVVEFQRVEALVNRPVAVVVTSRTVAADRVTIPDHCPVVTISDFTDDQVADWILRWNETNAGGPARPLPVAVARSQSEIARQPLLLLMLALYFADPDVELRTDLSTAELYRRLLRTYAEREVAKHGALRPEAREQEITALLRRLAIAALGMFNRGRQSITEAELTADLLALEENPVSGERLLGEFFFVHTAQAVSTSAQRSYEFLHLTFAEYLVANFVVDVLADKTTPTDDDLLFALLSHEPLSIQQPILFFLDERLAGHPELVGKLDALVDKLASRPQSRYFTTYLGVRRHQIKATAAYSANLVLLRTRTGKPIPLSKPPWATCWGEQVSLWEAGLTTIALMSVLDRLRRKGNRIQSGLLGLETRAHAGIQADVLRGDEDSAAQRLMGVLVASGNVELLGPFERMIRNAPDRTITLLEALPVEGWPDPALPPPPKDHYWDGLADRAWALLCTKPGRWQKGWARHLASWAFSVKSGAVPLRLAVAAYRHAEVLDLLADGDHWPSEAAAVMDLARKRHRKRDHGVDEDLSAALEGLVTDLAP
ncbi:NACHT domain-containing protein [Actinokineospora soli]|uniref:NACHT domain-containing protein n=1 Tax=Actinokineospora soli TaxID=1048753 RepID=A0ABW2TUW4_9PSEU